MNIRLNALYERYRERSYERVLSFPTLVPLIADAIVQHGGSGRRSFERAGEVGERTASIQAAYGKLRRLPIPLRMAFLAIGADRLRTVFPDLGVESLPSSLGDVQGVVLDGQALKRVAQRLQPLRGSAAECWGAGLWSRRR